LTSSTGVAIATHDLRKRYGARTALAGLDLSVPEGVVYGFLGPNGAGKTTTMRILTGLIHADGGGVEMLGRPFTRRDRHRLFEVGALVETPSFYPYLSGRENLRALAATGARTRHGRIDELLELVGLRDRAGDRVSGYSLGMKQRLGIAGALLSEPRLLLLDEPANGLDPAGIVAMRELLRQLARNGATVFVSSHLLAEVQQMADIVGIIAAGRLVREGRVADLLDSSGVVRVRVPTESLPAAVEAIAVAFVNVEVVPSASDPGWLAVHVSPDRAGDVNTALAARGIYATRLEAGNDLEDLFLELTSAASAADPDGTFMGSAGVSAQPGTGR
jgi:ABC-2 type transport system ATP-binding protein